MTGQQTVPFRQANSPVDHLFRVNDSEFKVHSDAYTSQAVFELEMKKIFERTWVYLGHESEIDHPGAYKTAHIGMQPVILTRDDESRLNVMVNRCVHRGAVVCRERSGTANLFRCPYHGWVYKNDGSLSGLPMRSGDSGYGENFCEPEGLFRLPRVESYRGLVFASFNADVEDLVTFLGSARDLLDNKIDESPVGKIRIRSKPYVGQYEGNWKFASENIVDGYHFTYVHEAFLKLQKKYGGTTGDFGVHKGTSGSEERKIRATGSNTGCVQGHGLSTRTIDDHDSFLEGKYGDYFRQLLELRGTEKFSELIGPGAACIYPNFGFIHHQLRTWRPIAPGITEVSVYLYDLEGVSDEVNYGWMRSQERFYGPAGHGQPDDVEVFALNQQGLQGSAVEWLILERGLEAEKRLDNGDYSGTPAGETNQRAFWRRWQEMMNAE